MNNVVSFPRHDEEKAIWRCDCGCVSFMLRADGEAECVQCGVLVVGDGGGWRERLPEMPLHTPAPEPDTVRVTDLGSSDAALRRTLGRAQVGTTFAVLIFQRDGGVSTWGDWIETQEQAEWFDRRVATAKQMLIKR